LLPIFNFHSHFLADLVIPYTFGVASDFLFKKISLFKIIKLKLIIYFSSVL